MIADPSLRLAADLAPENKPPATDPIAQLGNRPDAGRPVTLAAAVVPLLVGRSEAAAMTGVSQASWDRLSAAAKNPAPVKVGGRVLYRVEDLKLWVALGCPDRKTFEARRALENVKGRPR